MTEERVNGSWVVQPDVDLEDLIPEFLQNRRTDLAQLKLAVNRRDFEFVRRTAHTLKGICRPYGFIHLEELSQRLEKAGQLEVESDVNGLINEMVEYVSSVKVEYHS